ncbi:MAG: hypothetical protein AAFV51_10345 [Pseudomonadota bacterium]
MAEVYGFGGEEVRKESSWRYALGVFFATLVLSAFFLYHYVGPSVDDLSGAAPKPTISDDRAAIAVGDAVFSVPANHTVFPRARRSGRRPSVALYALWPTMSPYSPARRSEFVENDSRSRRIDIQIDGSQQTFDEQARLDRLYMPLTLPNSATRTPSGLIRYGFVERRPDTPTNGYRDSELFIGDLDDGQRVVLLCGIEMEINRSPDCRREYEFAGVSVVYRFKRPYLPEWRAIDARVRAFVSELYLQQAEPATQPAQAVAAEPTDAVVETLSDDEPGPSGE